MMNEVLLATFLRLNLTLRSTFGHLAATHASGHAAEIEQNITGGNVTSSEMAHEIHMNTHYYFLIIPNLWAIISNLMVIVTIFRTATILRSFAYVMISLSLVDLCSSLFVIPFSIYFFASHMHWGLGYPLCVFWTAADVMFCTASICHHCSIALHRYLMISKPHSFSVTNNHKIIYRLIVPAWCVSAFIALILVVRSCIDGDLVYDQETATCGINDRSYAIYSSIVSFFIPLSIIVVVSLRSIFILQKRIDFKRRSHYGLRRGLQLNAARFTPERRKTMSTFFRQRRDALRRQGTRRFDDDEATGIIFATKKPRLQSKGSKNKVSIQKELGDNSIYKALETFTNQTLPQAEEFTSLQYVNGGLLLAFGPKSSRNSNSTLVALTRPASAKDLTNLDHKMKQNGVHISASLDLGKMRRKSLRDCQRDERVNHSKVTASDRQKMFSGLEEMSHVTEEIVDEMSISQFSPSKINLESSNSLTPSAAAVTRPTTLRQSLCREDSYASTVMDNNSDFHSVILSMPDIEWTSELDSSAYQSCSQEPQSTTKTTQFDETPILEADELSALQLDTTSVMPRALCRSANNLGKSRLTPAPIIRMNSLEHFDSSSIRASPAILRHHLSIKKLRRPTLPPGMPSLHGTPKPIARRFAKRPAQPGQPLSSVNTRTTESLQNLQQRNSLCPSLNEAAHRRYSEAIGYGNGIIGGPFVPEKFLEMVKQKDHERQVALVKRGKIVHAPSKVRISVTLQLNQRLRTIKRVISRGAGDKDIALQALARRIKKEKQAGHALLVVLTCFVLMWAPFFSINIAYGICGDCVSKTLFTLFSWTGWASCGVNPIIYTLCSRQFRQGLFRSLADAFGRVSTRSRSMTRSLTRSMTRSMRIQ